MMRWGEKYNENKSKTFDKKTTPYYFHLKDRSGSKKTKKKRSDNNELKV